MQSLRYTFFAIFLSIAASVSACNCSYNASETWEQATTREFYYASTIFLGKVINIEAIEGNKPNYLKTTQSPVKYTFEVIEMIKGRPTSKILTIYSSWTTSACGYLFELGQKYLVYSKRSTQFSEFIKEKWTDNTAQCIGNTLRRRTEKKRLDLLRKLASS